jgi:hypothetical protein
MPITSPKGGYPIPDDPEPEGYYCVRVYVPHDQLYMGAFWQSLHYLASPRAWANDQDHTALVAADVWKAAIQKSQENDTCQKGDCGIVDVRQGAEPCKLEKLDDCSGEWEEFADITLCSQAMPEPAQEQPDDEINDALWTIKTIIEQVDTYLDDGKSASEIKIIMSGTIAKLPGLVSMIDDMAATSAEDRQTALDGMDWQEMKDTISCDRTECHLENFAWYTAFTQDWTACLMRNIVNWAAGASGKIADWAADFINDTMPSWLLDIINLFPGGGDGFGFNETVCYWEHVWDAEHGLGDWVAQVIDGLTYGEYSYGAWRSVSHNINNFWYCHLIVDSPRQYDNVTFTKIEVHYIVVASDGGLVHQIQTISCDYSHVDGYENYDYSVGNHEYIAVQNQANCNIRFNWQNWGQNNDIVLVYVKATGIGEDPWA